MAAIKIKRIYDKPSTADGYRILVDRVWPRGVTKEKARLDIWLKEVAPSTQLRKWFNHEDDKWSEFLKKYKQELKDNKAFDELKDLVKKHKTATLLYGAKNEEHNQAVALKSLLKQG